MSPHEIRVRKMLEICREIEMAAAQLYHWYGDSFRDDPALCRLWRKLALEEENHARHFSLVLRMRGAPVLDVAVSPGEPEKTLAAVRHLVAVSREETPVPEEALRTAVTLGQKLCALHLDCVARFQDDAFRAMFRSMMRHDQQITELRLRLRDINEGEPSAPAASAA